MDRTVEIIVKKHLKSLKKKKNFVGFEGTLKPKIIRGKEYKNIPAFRIYVSKKEPVYKLEWKDLIPKALTVGDTVVATDIVEIGEIKALKPMPEPIPQTISPRDKFRPIVIGCSSTHYQSTACTTNCFFRDKETGKILLAYNNHCAARENKAKLGDPMLQPSPYDGGKYPEDIVGHLYKYYPIEFEKYNCPFRETFAKLKRIFFKPKWNEIDIAFVEPSVEWKNQLVDGKKPKGKGFPKLGNKEGREVYKWGRTTGYTEGVIVSTDWNGYVGYSRGRAFFTNCILIQGEGFSAPGDSGSAVYLKDCDNYIGALFAGSDTHTIVCKVERIEELCNVEVYLE